MKNLSGPIPATSCAGWDVETRYTFAQVANIMKQNTEFKVFKTDVCYLRCIWKFTTYLWVFFCGRLFGACGIEQMYKTEFTHGLITKKQTLWDAGHTGTA